MNTAEALLQAIIENPAEDGPRLIYADWLDEQGQHLRAEFIRVQCRLHDLPPDAPDYWDLKEREAELRVCFGDRHPFEPEYGVGFGTSWIRGFPSAVHLTAWNRDGANSVASQLVEFRREQPLERLTASDLNSEELTDLLKHPALECVQSLRLYATPGKWHPVGGDQLAKLMAAATGLKNLRELWLQGCPLGPAGARALVETPSLRYLTSFHGVMGSAALRALSRAPWFRRLRSLRLEGRSGYGDICAALAEVPSLPELHTLCLGENCDLPGGLRRLTQSRSFPRLTALWLAASHCDSASMECLADQTWPLTDLVASGRYCDDLVSELLQAPFASSLRRLRLFHGGVNSKAAAALAQSPQLSQLRQLDVSYNWIGGTALLALADSPYLRQLTTLQLDLVDCGHDPITPAHARQFCAALNMPGLRHLSLRELPLGAGGAQALARNAQLRSLTVLDLSSTKIRDSGAAALLTSPHLQKLLQLRLNNNLIHTGHKPLYDPTVLPDLVDCQLRNNLMSRSTAERVERRVCERHRHSSP